MRIPFLGRPKPVSRVSPPDNHRQFASGEPGAIVITNIDWKGRKVPLSYGGHVCGWHPVRPGHGAIQFESLLERNTITALARCGWIQRIESQPVTVDYQLDGKRHSYTPDLLIHGADVPQDFASLGFSDKTFIECKPHDLVAAQDMRLQRHFRAMVLAINAPIVLITDRDLGNGLLGSRHG